MVEELFTNIFGIYIKNGYNNRLFFSIESLVNVASYPEWLVRGQYNNTSQERESGLSFKVWDGLECESIERYGNY